MLSPNTFSEVKPVRTCTLPSYSFSRVKPAMPEHSYPTQKSRWEYSLYPSTPFRELIRQSRYTLLLFGSHARKFPVRFLNHSKVMPESPPGCFHLLLSE